MSRLDEKVAIVTGAAQGMGLGTARELADRGAVCALVDLNSEKLGAALDCVKQIGARACSYELDVARKEQWVEMTDDLQTRFGSIDILVNAAAVFDVVSFQELTESQWDRVFAVNAKGVLFGVQAVAPHMEKQRSGRIINFSSQAGKTGGLLIGAHYSASKAAVICMTKTFASALGVTVNAVAPGIIETPFLDGVPGIEKFFEKIPLGQKPGDVSDVAPGIIETPFLDGVPGIEKFFEKIPLGQKPGDVSDVAKTIAFLVSEDARYITGEIVDVNGGLLMD